MNPTMRLRARSVAAAVFLLASCRGDSTAPKSSFALTLTLVGGGPSESITETPTGAQIVCTITVNATVRGQGKATWKDGVIRLFAGADRTKLADSLPISHDETLQLWGSQPAVGSVPQTGLALTASIPYEAELEFRYVTDDGTPGAASTRFACGPKPPAGGAVPPTITNVTVTPATGELEPGQTFTVTYTASSPYALWATSVRITGPYLFDKQTAERGVATSTRSLQFTVPAGSLLNVPIGVNVAALDPGLQSSAKFVQTHTVVVDRTPPVIRQAVLTNGATSLMLAGHYAVGDMMRLFVEAHDNNALAWLVWNLGAPANVRDSVAAPAGSPDNNWSFAIPVRPEWVGSPSLSIRLRDAAGLESTVFSSPPDSLSFYPLVTHPSTAAAPATSTQSPVVELGDVAYDAKRNQFYVALLRTKEVAVLDVPTMTYKTPLAIPATAAGIDLSPSGDSLIVSLAGTRSLAVVNLVRPSDPPSTIQLSVLDTAGAALGTVLPQVALLRVAANGKAIVGLAGRTKAGDGVVEVDLRTGAQKIRTDARSTSPYPRLAMGRSSDGGTLALYDRDCPRIYTSATDTFGPCPKLPDVWINSAGITFDAAGQHFSLGNGAVDLNFTVLRIGPAINMQMPVSSISPDGAYLYLGANNTMTKFRIADGAYMERTNIPVTAQRMYTAPGGEWVIVFQNDYAVRAARVDLK